ncbi:MAG: Gfo/Idh/MocA family oxidoreductase [Pirellulaceae bacterium]|nr:Gfo/Idh/MocA family oxidoreductase [Pirellulaceae bacterium]
MKNLALIGAGYWGKNLARNFNALGALHTLCDASDEVLASYGPDYAGVKHCKTIEQALADAAVTRVAIAAPAHLHFQIAKAALLADKDVYVEKPLCLELADAAQLVELAKQRGRILMVGHLLQYHPCVAELQRLVGTGELGKLQYITSNRLNLGKIRQEENALWSFAPHDISVILSLVGHQLPQEVRCMGEAYLTNGVADTTLSTLKFPGGVRAHIYVTWLNPFKEQKLTVVGSQGMVVFDDTRPWHEKLIIHRNYLTWTDGRNPTPNKSAGEFLVAAELEPLRQECAHFIDCCNNRTQPRTDGAEGLRVLQVLKAAQESLLSDGDAFQPAQLLQANTLDYFSHPTALVDPQARVGRGCKIWHFSHVMANAQLGENCNLGQNVVVSPGVRLGNNVKIQNNVSIYTGTTIEDDVFLGPSCVLTNVSNPRSQVNRRNLYEQTTIRRGASIGANATIVCGTTLGRYCFVAAGAVVTKDVPDYALVRGNPARQVGWMSRHGHRLNFDQSGLAICPESKLRYQLKSLADGQQQVQCLDLDEEQSLSVELSVGSVDYRSFKDGN